MPYGIFALPDSLWARVVYDAAVAYRNRVLPRDHVLKAFTPLYLGGLPRLCWIPRG